MIPQIIASIGWPIAALIFGIFFVLLFRKPLCGFIERIRSVSKDGLSTESIPKAQIEESKKRAVEDLMQFGDSMLLKEVEAAIAAILEKKGLDTVSDSVKVLTRHLAATQIALEFEQVHSVIFGSQIYLLKKLNEYPSVGLDSDFVAQHFAHVQKVFQENLGNWTIDQYLSFLLDRVLMREDFGKYHITVRGAEFLIWMIRMNRSESRPL